MEEETPAESFKKPILVGKIGRLPRKITETKVVTPLPDKETNTIIVQDTPEDTNENVKVVSAPAQQITENTIPLPYKEPTWSGLPVSVDKDYAFEVLKNGSIIETVNLMNKPFWVFGRLANCDIIMQHPTISRYHAVIQYRSTSSETEQPGFYIYDLGSTHGTFLNKNKLKSRVYVKIQVGHMLKLGCSTRSYILAGPDNDAEEESEFTITELKEKRAEELRKRAEEEKEAKLKAEMEEEIRRKKEEERGVDWGLGEDAEEETDLSENPYAQTNNEELYLDDPKKALRGFFEREGLDLEYDCNEQGMGQFLCKVELPLDDELGRPVVAEVLHKGKKKEAVIQCALEACRVLDRHGVLRQATHESRKRKAKNWEENDYYDSDDDTFLDRTGAVEKKREMRMKAKLPPKAETYESLLEKETTISKSILDLENQLTKAQASLNVQSKSTAEEDPLDSFMKELKQSKPDKQSVIKLKADLNKLKTEHANVIRLVNIAKPASLPPLVPQYTSLPSTSKATNSKSLPIFGKRIKLKVQLPAKPKVDNENMNNDEDDEDSEENEENPNESITKTDDIVSNSSTTVNENQSSHTQNEEQNVNSNESDSSRASQASSDDEDPSARPEHRAMTFRKFEMILKKGLLPLSDKYQEKFTKILNKLKKLATNEDRMHADWKMLAAKKRKVMKLISDLPNCEPNEKLEQKVSSELNRILAELNSMTEQKYKVIGQVKQMGHDIKNISEAINNDYEKYKKNMSKLSSPSCSKSTDVHSLSDSEEKTDDADNDEDVEMKSEIDEKKRKKNQRRIHQRQEKAEVERQRAYEEDANRDDYSMWIPPDNQSGDGRTSLNDRLGY